MVNGTAALENSLTVPFLIKELLYEPAFSTAPKGNKNMRPPKNFGTNVQSSFTHSSQNMEAKCLAAYE